MNHPETLPNPRTGREEPTVPPANGEQRASMSESGNAGDSAPIHDSLPRSLKGCARAKRATGGLTKKEREKLREEFNQELIEKWKARGFFLGVGLLNQIVGILLESMPMTPRDKKILMMRLEGNTMEEVGKAFGVHRERIRQIESRILQRIRDFYTQNAAERDELRRLRIEFDHPEPTRQEKYTPIEILNFSPRTLNALINAGVGSIEQLTKCNEYTLSNFRGFGNIAMNEVKEALYKRNLSLTRSLL